MVAFLHPVVAIVGG
ncbi:hypothetical protein HaLaN_32783, partial [Haematococcus lacustris]